MAGVSPVQPIPVSCSCGPGSENLTRFLVRFGVEVDFCAAVVSGAAVVLCLVRRETGAEFPESEIKLLHRFLPACLVSIVDRPELNSGNFSSFYR